MPLGDVTLDRSAASVFADIDAALRLTTEPVDLSPRRDGPTRTWVRARRDVIVPPERGAHSAETVAPCPLVGLDAGHMGMASRRSWRRS